MAGYFAEMQQIRETLHGRYDDLKKGKIKRIPGKKVEAHFREKKRRRPFEIGFMTQYVFHPDARDDLDEIWDYIATDNPDAADRVITEVLEAIRAVVPFPHSGH